MLKVVGVRLIRDFEILNTKVALPFLGALFSFFMVLVFHSPPLSCPPFSLNERALLQGLMEGQFPCLSGRQRDFIQILLRLRGNHEPRSPENSDPWKCWSGPSPQHSELSGLKKHLLI